MKVMENIANTKKRTKTNKLNLKTIFTYKTELIKFLIFILQLNVCYKQFKFFWVKYQIKMLIKKYKT